jgi:hypothetical protein
VDMGDTGKRRMMNDKYNDNIEFAEQYLYFL